MIERVVRSILLDNEAVQALLDRSHRKHRRVLHVLDVGTPHPRVGSSAPRLLVPTTVRVEAGWDRRAPRAAAANRFLVADLPLDGAAADQATALRAALRISVTDAHLAAAVALEAGPCAVVTSDVHDLRRIAAHLDLPVSIVAL